MPTATLLEIATALRTAADALDAADAGMAGFRALAEAVVAYDRDGMSDEDRPEWSRVVRMAKAALAAK